MLLGENDGPLVVPGNHVQTVSAFGQRLSFDRNWIGEGDGGVLIRPGPPYFIVRHNFAPYRSALNQRTMIVNGDVGDPDSLDHHRVLAITRQVQKRRLRV